MRWLFTSHLIHRFYRATTTTITQSDFFIATFPNLTILCYIPYANHSTVCLYSPIPHHVSHI